VPCPARPCPARSLAPTLATVRPQRRCQGAEESEPGPNPNPDPDPEPDPNPDPEPDPNQGDEALEPYCEWLGPDALKADVLSSSTLTNVVDELGIQPQAIHPRLKP